MALKALPALAGLLMLSSVSAADGCKYSLNGRFVPEREQRAMIEWADGVETLYVAALSEPTSEASVWVVPVRGAASTVRAEPVEDFPVVGYYETLQSRARERLRDWIAFTAVLNSGGLCCPIVIGGCDDKKSAFAKEESRVERLGMIVTVVSAKSKGELEGYLESQGIGRRSANLASLDAYFGRDFAFVCGWVSRTGEPATATGLKVEFPSPNIWFPLRPTKAYANSVPAVVYVRGFVKPANECDLAGLRCDYLYGKVEQKSVSRSFAAARTWERTDHYATGADLLLTRVTFDADPQTWDQDLELVSGTTRIGYANLAILGRAGNTALIWSSVLGALLGVLIPRITIAREYRTLGDYIGGGVTGAAIAFSIWGSLLSFIIWRTARPANHPGRWIRGLVVPALALVHFAVVFGICRALMEVVAPG